GGQAVALEHEGADQRHDRGERVLVERGNERKVERRRFRQEQQPAHVDAENRRDGTVPRGCGVDEQGEWYERQEREIGADVVLHPRTLAALAGDRRTKKKPTPGPRACFDVS